MSRIDRNQLLRENQELAKHYRLVTEEDLQPEASLYIVDILPHDHRPSKVPQIIQLDVEPVQMLEGNKPYVFYHNEDGKSQGMIARDQFLGVDVETDQGPYLTTLFLVAL